MRNKFNGLITFYSSHHAIRAENALKSTKMQCNLIPGPKELSPNCGVALQFFYTNREKVTEFLKNKKIIFEKIHKYANK